MTEGFWEDAFPPLRRMRGRQAALQFVAERTSAWLQTEDNRPTPDDREALEHAEAEAAALQAFVTEAMGEDAPAFSGVLREIREALRRLPTPAPPDVPTPETPAEGADTPAAETAAAPAAASPPPAPSSGSDDATFNTISDAQAAVMRASWYLQEEDPYNAVSFTLRRAIRWGEIVQTPPTGVIPAPPQHRRDALAGMLAASNHALLVSEGEGIFPEPPHHLWLDLQRLLAAALRALGPPAAAACTAVEDATAALVRRLPALPTLTFQDGTPFADPLTVSWLSDLAADGDSGAGAASGASEAAIREAREQAGSGDVPGAVAALMAGAGAPQDRFERTVVAAELCLGAGRPDVALGLLDDADAAIHQHRLDVWAPATAARALRLLHTCCSSLASAAASPERGATLSDRADDVFNRLTRLDPAHAMRSAPPPNG